MSAAHASSSLRTQGPIPPDPTSKAQWQTVFAKPPPVAMGPCVRRDDLGDPFRVSPSPRPPVAGILRHVAVPGLLADVVLLVVAMALGGVERHVGGTAGALVALVVLGD